MARKKIKQSLFQIVKLFVLMFLKEAWLLFRNLLGLIYHPFLTLRRIRREKDKSQALLILTTITSPILLLMTIDLAVYLTLKFTSYQFSKFAKKLINFSNLYIFMLIATAVTYLVFWTYQVIKKNHYQLFIKEE